MSDLQTEVFYENVYEKHWGEFLADCEESKIHPSTSDFLIWLDENNLIPDMDYEND